MLNNKKLLIGMLIAGIAIGIFNCGNDNNSTHATNHPPYQPFSPSPNSGSSNRSIDSDLNWRCDDPDGDLLSYDVYFDTIEPPQLVVEHYPYTLYALGALDPQTTYYWKIVAFDQLNESTSGPLWVFTTGDTANAPPNEPSNPSPADSALEQPLVVTLTWTCTDPNIGAYLSYDIYLDTTAYLSKTADDLSEAAYTTDQLEPETQYFWKVVAFDNEGDSTVGPIWNFTTGTEASGVFAAMSITRIITQPDDSLVRLDEVVVRFDSLYAPYNPIQPLEADGVTCGDIIIDWQDEYQCHRHSNSADPVFIELGESYVFQVTGNSKIPALADTIEFPDTETYLTDPADGDTVSLMGFAAQWAGSGTGTVIFMIISGVDTTDLDIETENDGEYEFSEDDLLPLGNQDDEYGIILIHRNSKDINTAGYDPRSYIRARVMNITNVYFE
jgi:hypothetical protein